MTCRNAGSADVFIYTRKLFGSGAAALIALVIGALHASAADYYAGKTIDMLIGSGPAGGYDIYGRALARHIPRHIPGKPHIVVKNMPGAGSQRAAGFLATRAPQDGTAIAGIMPGAIMAPLLGEGKVLFDPTKVHYIGTANNGTRVCVAWAASGIKSFDDVLKKEVAFGGVSLNESTHDYAHMLRRTAGAKYKVVAGYDGTTQIGLAMERGEVVGACGWDWASFKAQRSAWLRDKKVNVILQIALEPNAELTKMGVPHVWDYVKSDENRKIVELIIGQQVFQRSYIAPPKIPAEPLKILRTAFDATVKDPEYLADAKKMKIDIEPLSGDKVQAIVLKLHATPKDIVQKARQVIRP
jgi:tripartite-type tricarboxylate transporter receptor subunit TctC